MEIELNDMDSYVGGFNKLDKYSKWSNFKWLHKIREEAINSFSQLGYPTLQDEDWRFTNLAPISRTSQTIKY